MDYKPIGEVDPMFKKVARSGLTALERKVETAIKTKGRENSLLTMIQDRDEIFNVVHIYQGTDYADFFWNLQNWDYFSRQRPEKKKSVYRLIIAAGYFMEPEKMHPEMINAVRYAERELERD